MSELRKVSSYFKNIADELIKEEPELESILNSNAAIQYLESDYNKTKDGKTVLGLTEKVRSINQWAIPFDYTVTIYTENIKGFSEEQVKVLMFHELLHIDIDGDKYGLKTHDLEDFKLIVDKYGTNWDKIAEN